MTLYLWIFHTLSCGLEELVILRRSHLVLISFIVLQIERKNSIVMHLWSAIERLRLFTSCKHVISLWKEAILYSWPFQKCLEFSVLLWAICILLFEFDLVLARLEVRTTDSEVHFVQVLLHTRDLTDFIIKHRSLQLWRVNSWLTDYDRRAVFQGLYKFSLESLMAFRGEVIVRPVSYIKFDMTFLQFCIWKCWLDTMNFLSFRLLHLLISLAKNNMTFCKPGSRHAFPSSSSSRWMRGVSLNLFWFKSYSSLENHST